MAVEQGMTFRTPIFVGIDLGTSGVKAIAVDRAGQVVGTTSHGLDFDRPRQGWAETPPSRWWDATAAAVGSLVAGGLDASSIAAVGLSGQMHGSVFLDRAALDRAGSDTIDAIHPALMWNDQRTESSLAPIESALGGRAACVERTGCPPLTGLTAPKLHWLRTHEPAHAERVAALCLPKDYLALALTGELATDVGDASGTMLLDPRTRDWSPAVLDALKIDRAMLPAVHESGTAIGRVTRWAAEHTGLPAGTPIAIGSGDNQAAALGAGVTDPGSALAILGTSGVVLAPLDEPKTDHTPTSSLAKPGRINLFCDATGSERQRGAWLYSGCMLSAAGSLEWARDTISPGVAFDDLLREAGEAPAGCEGLIFLPYLTGERCPIPDPQARGGWIGLTRSHTRAHLMRAVLEGVAFNLAAILDIVRDATIAPSTVRVTGGGSASPEWCRILATAFGCPVVPLEVEEGPALGAAICAAVSIDAALDARALARGWSRPAQPIEPVAATVPVMREARAVFERLHADLSPAHAALHTLASDNQLSSPAPKQIPTPDHTP